MSKIDDKYFSFLPYQNGYNYQDKQQNVNNYVKYMVNRSLAMFKYHNLPDTIPQDELEKMLQCGGLAVWYKHNEELYVFNANLGGEGDVYNRPTKAIISNPYLKLNKECTINEDCILMLNDSMCMGLIPLYQKYCTIINETDITMILATINKRIQILLSANDDNTVESAKQFISNIENGKLGVIAESKLFDSLKTNTVANSNNKNLQDIYELQQYLKASMYNEIGLNANWNNKRERLIASEVEMNSDNLYPLVDDMLNNRRKALEKVNEMFGTNIQVEFNSSWDYRVLNGESIHNTDEEVEMSELETSEEPTTEPSEEPTTEPTTEPSEESEGVENEKDTKTSPEQSEDTTDNDKQSEEPETEEPETDEPETDEQNNNIEESGSDEDVESSENGGTDEQSDEPTEEPETDEQTDEQVQEEETEDEEIKKKKGEKENES